MTQLFEKIENSLPLASSQRASGGSWLLALGSILDGAGGFLLLGVRVLSVQEA